MAITSNAPIVITDKLNGKVYGYAAAHDLLGAGSVFYMSSFPPSVFEIVNNTATPIPVDVPGGADITVPANGAAVVSTHSNTAPGRSAPGKANQGGAI